MRRRALAISSSVAALGLIMLSASPASAATLPATDELYSLAGDRLYSTTSTGASTLLSDLNAPGSEFGADFDVTTGDAYFFSEIGEACDLYSLDPATGIPTLVGAVTGTGVDECDAINVALDGTLRIADQDGVILTIDKATGATISSLAVVGVDAISFIEQASTGTFYVGDYNGSIYTLDVATGATVFIAQPVSYIETASFDSEDTLWFSGDGVGGQGLSSLSVADPVGTLQFEGNFLDGVNGISAFALFITQAAAAPAPVVPAPPTVPAAPQLAATGAISMDAMLPFAVLSLIAGAGALALSRRTRTA